MTFSKRSFWCCRAQSSLFSLFTFRMSWKVSRTTKCQSQLLSAAQHCTEAHGYTIVHKKLMQLCCCCFIICSHLQFHNLTNMICYFQWTSRPWLAGNCAQLPIPVWPLEWCHCQMKQTATWLSRPPTLSACSIFIFPLHCHVQSIVLENFAKERLNNIWHLDTAHEPCF